MSYGRFVFVIAGIGLVAGCTATADGRRDAGSDGSGEVPPAAATWEGPAVYRTPQVQFSHDVRTGEARAYLPVTHPACKKEPNRTFQVLLRSLYRFEPDPTPKPAGSWQAVGISPEPVAISCNQTLAVAALTGRRKCPTKAPTKVP